MWSKSRGNDHNHGWLHIKCQSGTFWQIYGRWWQVDGLYGLKVWVLDEVFLNKKYSEFAIKITSDFALEMWQIFKLGGFCGWFQWQRGSGRCKQCIKPLHFITTVISDEVLQLLYLANVWHSENSHPNVRHFIQCFIQIKLSFIRNEADSCHHRRRLTNLQQSCHYEETQAGHKAIFEAQNLCLKLYYTEINIWQNQRILHTDLTFTLGLVQRCTVTAE